MFLLVALISAFSLFLSLPYEWHPRFWDEARLWESVSIPGFAHGQGVPVGDYGTQKYGYALVLHWMLPVFGPYSPVVLNLFWFVVLLVTPILFRGSVLRIVGTETGQRDVVGSVMWVGWIVYAAGLLSFPFVTKYLWMASPTMMAMAIWLLFSIELFRFERTWLAGALGALVVVTDPKWSLAVPFATLVSEIYRVRATSGAGWFDFNWARFEWRRVLRVVAWPIGAVVFLGLWNPAYMETTIRGLYFGSAGTVHLHFGVSSNFWMYLFMLGGSLLIPVAVAIRFKEPLGVFGHLLVVAAAVLFLFSVVLWPRPARVFAPTFVLLLLFVSWSIGRFFRSFTTNRSWSRCYPIRTRICFVLVGLLAVEMCAFGVVSGRDRGAETGCAAIAAHLSAEDGKRVAGPVGTYLFPVFRAHLPGDSTFGWEFLPATIHQSTDWAVLSNVVDGLVIEEQAASGNGGFYWRMDKYKVRGVMTDIGKLIAHAESPFYATSTYLSETALDDVDLIRTANQISSVENPRWELWYVGGLFGRSLPVADSTMHDTSGANK
jgi:hypothetical protein